MLSDAADARAKVERFQSRFQSLQGEIAKEIVGYEDVVEKTLIGLFAGGHVLLEGVPGIGKTTLVRVLAKAVDLKFSRVQFSPDLMPADIVGTNVLVVSEDGNKEFRFQPGPVFANIVLADEINRATPKTQSALLEAMQEHRVTVGGTTYELDQPFFVLGTQNPIEMEGTYPLPEAQLDRFLLKVTIAMPDRDALVAVLDATTGIEQAEHGPVLGREELLAMSRVVRGVPASSEIARLVSTLVLATHPSNSLAPESVRTYVRHGASPRGGQAILFAGKARALCRGRVHVTEEDVQALAVPALRHRVLLGYEGEAAGVSTDELVRDALRAAGRAS